MHQALPAAVHAGRIRRREASPPLAAVPPPDDHRPNRPLSPDEAKLIERYAELFPDRQLRCRQCLGLRYGEVKQ